MANRKRCDFCYPDKETRSRILKQTKNFFILSDIGPIVPGHLLLIPKKHIPCLATMDKNLEKKFLALKDKITFFSTLYYGFPLIFEHGITGQTIFHAHLHFIPTPDRLLFNPPTLKKVLEKIKTFDANISIRKIKSLEAVKRSWQKRSKYLYLEENSEKYLVYGQEVPPRFLRDVIAEILGVPERGNWREVTDGQEILKKVKKNWIEFPKIKSP